MTDFDTVLSPQPLFLSTRCQASPCLLTLTDSLGSLNFSSDSDSTDNTSILELKSQSSSTKDNVDDDDDNVEFTQDMYANVEKFFDEEGFDVVSVEEFNTPKLTRAFVQLRRLPPLQSESASQNEMKENLPANGCVSRILAARKARSALGMLATSSGSNNFSLFKRNAANLEVTMESPLA